MEEVASDFDRVPGGPATHRAIAGIFRELARSAQEQGVDGDLWDELAEFISGLKVAL